MNNEQNELKQKVATTALDFINEKSIIGIGTGTTVKYLIDVLPTKKHLIEGCVSSSNSTTEKLTALGIPVFDLNDVTKLSLYIDSADEINSNFQMIKGGGGALTREKIVAAAADKYVCIADQTKKVDVLGKFPLPVEVIPMARSYVAREISKEVGGDPVYRQGVVTDNGNIILDIHNLTINDPLKVEERLNHITGVVCNGIFARRSADILVLGTNSGVEIFTK